MQRFAFGFGLFAALGMGLAPSAYARQGSAPEEGPPNILLIVIDDIGVDQVGAYAAQYPGLPQPCTPNLDALAASGARFTNAWSSAVCSPTRAMIMTGKPGHRTGIGVVTNSQVPQSLGLRPTQQTIATILASVDYRTAAFGKWHLADSAQTEICQVTQPIQLGFEFYSGSLYNLESPTPEVDPPAYDYWVRTAVNGQSTLRASMLKYATLDTTDEALAWVGATTDPWFLYVAYNASHAPYHCPTADLCPTEGPGACSWCASCNELPGQDYFCSPNLRDDNSIMTRAMTRALDHEIGRLLDGVPADTAVFLIGDNGTPSDATLEPFDPCHAKGTPYQGGFNVPLLARVPDVFPAGMVCDELVCATDLLDTIADLAGAAYDDTHVDSVSLLQYTDPEQPHCGGTNPREDVYSQNFSPNFVPSQLGLPPVGYKATYHVRAIRNARFKLIEWRENGDLPGGGPRYEMYALSDDLPQDDLPEDPALGPDPFEASDLLLLYPRPSYVQAAFDELLERIDGDEPQDYKPLPIHEGGLLAFSESTVQEAAQFSFGEWCLSGDVARVGYVDDTYPYNCRTFLEFQISGIPCQSTILGVELEMNVQQGAGNASTVVDVRRVPGPFGDYCCAPTNGCTNLYDSIDGATLYASKSGWAADCSFKRFSLGVQAKADLQAVVQSCSEPLEGRWFRVGLRLQDEASLADRIELRNSGHRLYVTYQEP
jgi:arylsulfatase A-like enzyme